MKIKITGAREHHSAPTSVNGAGFKGVKKPNSAVASSNFFLLFRWQSCNLLRFLGIKQDSK
jgi:hypothetical protein